MVKEKANLTLNTETKETLQNLKEVIPEVTNMSNAVDFVVKDYWRMKKEMEFIDAQTLNAAQRMTAMDVNISIIAEMVTHLCYETATQIDGQLDYFQREDLNLESETIFDQSDPMYQLFRNRVLAFKKQKRESRFL
ncbi:hypothetical protein HCA55_17100 [Listeria booriae]|uniref:Uncharacterized protein n=1 Tax=Listeria booriae TaxID=1552123 RepID=A0A7X1AAP1_9LIST|nr:hypothetical protein [Listeria booriae]MBC1567218.1 hypothetical protein [Listeria booriae]MBC1798459.1 hypothetical protein [Listeria booriae]MBC2164872.1 hypothetical protein [Listeria booriae]MBC2174804.1 hypothetical protein [Listeria booriae]MBC2373699.1 hypothetical protein [Listeria booriae]